MRSKSPVPRKYKLNTETTPEKKQSSQQQNQVNIKDKVKIIIRIRPTLQNESPESFIFQVEENTLQIQRPGNFLHMKFSNILTQTSSQIDVFNQIQDSVHSFLTGVNSTIFAYGQTGAGKTYTIIGNYRNGNQSMTLQQYQQSDQKGVLSRALQLIIQETKKKPLDSCKLFISFYEVYNEKIYDLFNVKTDRCSLQPLEIREAKNGDVQIPDLITVQIHTLEQALHLLILGLQNRMTGSTLANEWSSRSHSIFQILLQQKGDDTLIDHGLNKESVMRIVDLAGSEKFKIPYDIDPNEKEIRILELTSINSSLSSLGHCISALIDKNRTHIPFRNSKLTRVLSDSLSGQAKIAFIVCISPSITASSETFSTLQFANRAKRAILDGRNLRDKSPSQISKYADQEYLQELQKALKLEKEKREYLEQQLKDESNNYDLQIEVMNLKSENSYLKDLVQQFQKQTKNSDCSPSISSSDIKNIKEFNNTPNKANNANNTNFTAYTNSNSNNNSSSSSSNNGNSNNQNLKPVVNNQLHQAMQNSNKFEKNSNVQGLLPNDQQRIVFVEDQLTERLKQELGLIENQLDNEELDECRKVILEQYKQSYNEQQQQLQKSSQQQQQSSTRQSEKGPQESSPQFIRENISMKKQRNQHQHDEVQIQTQQNEENPTFSNKKLNCNSQQLDLASQQQEQDLQDFNQIMSQLQSKNSKELENENKLQNINNSNEQITSKEKEKSINSTRKSKPQQQTQQPQQQQQQQQIDFNGSMSAVNNLTGNPNEQPYNNNSLLSIKDDLDLLSNNFKDKLKQQSNSIFTAKFQNLVNVESNQNQEETEPKSDNNLISQNQATNQKRNISSSLNGLNNDENHLGQQKNQLILHEIMNGLNNTGKFPNAGETPFSDHTNFEQFLKNDEKSLNISNVVYDLKKEMSIALSQLQQLQQKDNQIKINFNEENSLRSSKKQYDKPQSQIQQENSPTKVQLQNRSISNQY